MSTPGAAPIGLGAGGAGTTGTVQDKQRWFPIINAAGELIPPFSIVRLTDGERLTEEEGYRVHVEAKKPNGSDSILAITGQVSIPYDGTATAKGKATQDYPAWVAYDPSEGTPANGDLYGAVSGQWHASPDGTDFEVIGPAVTDGDQSRVLVRGISSGNPSDSLPGGECQCCPGCACYPDEADIITACSAVPCAYNNYNVIGMTLFNGNTTLAHDATCDWISDSFNVTTCEDTAAEIDWGSHYWKMSVAAGRNATTLELVGDMTLVYEVAGRFHPLCNNEFEYIPNCTTMAALGFSPPRKLCVKPVGETCQPCVAVPVTIPCCELDMPRDLEAVLSAPLCPTLDAIVIPISYDGFFGGAWHRWSGGFTFAPSTPDFCDPPYTFYFEVNESCEIRMYIYDGSSSLVWGSDSSGGDFGLICPFESSTSSYVSGSEVFACLSAAMSPGCAGTLQATVSVP